MAEKVNNSGDNALFKKLSENGQIYSTSNIEEGNEPTIMEWKTLCMILKSRLESYWKGNP